MLEIMRILLEEEEAYVEKDSIDVIGGSTDVCQ